MKLIQNRLYKSKIVPKKSYDNNNNFYKNHVKEVIKSMFRSSDIKRKYYPKQKGNLKQLYNLNTYFSEKTLEKNKYKNLGCYNLYGIIKNRLKKIINK